ncbi:MAG: caspase family protein [bacterium]
MAIYALLVGVNEYLSNKMSRLEGCHHDVELVVETLSKRFAIPEKNIKKLLSKDATKAAIVDSFQTHLGQAGSGDSVVFYFSGHGSYEPAAPEFWHIDPDKKLETLVCHDSDAGSTQLANKEIRYLISQLDKQLDHVVLIVDSCHSGHIHRVVEDGDVAIRQASFVSSARPMQDFIFYEHAVEEGWIDHIGKIPQGKSIVFTACRNTELSYEQNFENIRHGVFTYSLCKTLQSISDTPSYYNLLTHVRPIAQKIRPNQTPQIHAVESEMNKTFLGVDMQPLALKVHHMDQTWWLDAGTIHGLGIDDEVAIFPIVKDSEIPLLLARVGKTEPGRSLLNDKYSAEHLTKLSSLSDLDQHSVYSAKITHKNVEKLSFSIEASHANVELIRTALRTLKDGLNSSDFIEENSTTAEYKVGCDDNGQFFISKMIDKTSQTLFEPVKSAREVLKQLEHIKRFRQKLELNNPDLNVDQDTLQLVITDVRVSKDYIDNDVTLHYDQADKGVYLDDLEDPRRPSIRFAVRCNPNNPPRKPLYCALILFDSLTMEVNPTLLGSEKLEPSEKQVNFGGGDIRFKVPRALYDNGVTETEDFIKLIVSDLPFDEQILAQAGIESAKNSEDSTRGENALDNLLEQEMQYSHMRSFSFSKSRRIPEWYAKTFIIRVIR